MNLWIKMNWVNGKSNDQTIFIGYTYFTLVLYRTNKFIQKATKILINDDNEIFVSSASVWEMATKHRKGKLGKAEKVLANFERLIDDCDFKHLPVN